VAVVAALSMVRSVLMKPIQKQACLLVRRLVKQMRLVLIK
jgi:hypothetical protein